MVKSEQSNPQQTQRQETYLRALSTLPDLTIHLGHYQRHEVWARHCNPPPATVKVYKTEEKGSDVNLATYMLADAFRGDCNQLVVITNDSDLAEPIRIINSELKLRVIVLNPHSSDTAARNSARTGKPTLSRPSVLLKRVAYRVKDISSHGHNCHMTMAQFPQTVTDGKRGQKIKIPADWL